MEDDMAGHDPEGASDHDIPQDSEFRSALEALLSAYEPILAEDLKLAKSPDKVREAGERLDCEAEIALANQIFGKFWTEAVAVSILPPDVRERFGSIDKWRW